MPTIGETWELLDQHGRSTRGIVSEVTDTRVTLVSLTGTRTHSSAGRFEQQWGRVASPPVTSIRCSRCREAGILTFQRGTSPDFVCPRHLPVGVLATLHTTGAASVPEVRQNVIQCPDCGSTDPVEDARLGRLQRGEFGWWTCTLCSSRWGLISEPERTDNLGLWYMDTLLELTDTSIDKDDITLIECSASAWSALMNVPMNPDFQVPPEDVSRGTFRGVAARASSTLTPGSILVHARRAPAGSGVSRRPIQRIGGIGNRSSRSAALDTILGVVGALMPGIPAMTPLMGDMVSVFLDHIEEEKEEKVEPKITLSFPRPSVGERYYQRVIGKEVEVVRVEESEDGRLYVAVRNLSHTTIGSPPAIMAYEDFAKEYVRSGKPSTFPAPPLPARPPPVSVNEEWFDYDNDEYVLVSAVEEGKPHCVVRGLTKGRTRNVPLLDFENPMKFKKIVRLTAHQRLMLDDDE